MKKRNLLLITAVSIVVTIAIVIGVIKLISSYKSSSLTTSLPVPPQTVDRSITTNENGYLTYLIEGKIDSILSTKPLKINILVRTENIIPNHTEPVIKTINLGNDATVILRNLATNEESTISAFTSLKKDDDIVAWLVEPNTKLLELDKFTATKIIVNR